MSLSGLVVVDNADVGALGNHIHVTEVHAMSDVVEEEEMWVGALVQDAEPAGAADKPHSFWTASHTTFTRHHWTSAWCVLLSEMNFSRCKKEILQHGISSDKKRKRYNSRKTYKESSSFPTARKPQWVWTH